METITLGVIAVLVIQMVPLANANSDENITAAGDALQFILPITAGVATLFEPDWEGSK
jgi:hypothetical protein